MRGAVLLALAVAACGPAPDTVDPQSPGARIEASAVAAGIVADADHASVVGAWSRENDRLCIAPGGGGRDRIGIALDYGEGQGCIARGTVERHADRLALTFGDCRIAARFEGDRIVLPAVVPLACDRLCIGRASLAALSVERQSGSPADAAAMVAPDGTPLCGGAAG